MISVVVGALLGAAGFAQGSPATKRASGGTLDIQAHRGGRGNTVENVLPSFAWGLIDGASTLELDNGITKDGHVVVWHDEWIDAGKCLDTAPVEADDPDYPYVGKLIKDLTLAQLKTLDCGTLSQAEFPDQRTYPGTKLSTLGELFDFVSCVDPARTVSFNIESKVNHTLVTGYNTKGVNAFVTAQYAEFQKSGYLDRITYQSFDWRTLIEMQVLHPGVRTSALISSLNAYIGTPYLPIDLGGILADSITEAAIIAAATLGIDIVSPKIDAVNDGTRALVKLANGLGKPVLPWTVNDVSVAQDLIELGVQGIITDYPDRVRELADDLGVEVVSPLGEGNAVKWPQDKVLACLDQHLALQG
ncbi:PLC-like phosphodiesterase [Schizophyllum commune H4-8]|uniref:PLC-like phosphodiesterase n=1 Tax=Schizophyllum commune (strain H4-8 / FGSC 9210) TaxID=578458 RepID=UPI00215F5E96|nr:PLC-like phosphodiesterase [Schizophyllum commune H4-8]KAI5888168.1 PLC-like phosphodiesterase [Schizophyllum commune H4-8]